MTNKLRPPTALNCEPLIRQALAEDLASAGDITSSAVIEPTAEARARVIARQPGRICGLRLVEQTCALVDQRLKFEATRSDGDAVEAGCTVGQLAGPAVALLTAERTALNFLGHLSGIASTTARFCQAIAGTAARIVCTRKTTPGLRGLEKYAVRCGGGDNHRHGLYDGILIKDNHIAIAGSLRKTILRARQSAAHGLRVEVEVDTLDQLREALEAGAEIVLLDNMSLQTLRQAVDITNRRAITEASGGVTLETAAAVAATGVDLIAVGWITHSAPWLDIGLDFAESLPGQVLTA